MAAAAFQAASSAVREVSALQPQHPFPSQARSSHDWLPTSTYFPQLGERPLGPIEEFAPPRLFTKFEPGGSEPGELLFPLSGQRLAGRANHDRLPSCQQVDSIGVRL